MLGTTTLTILRLLSARLMRMTPRVLDNCQRPQRGANGRRRKGTITSTLIISLLARPRRRHQANNRTRSSRGHNGPHDRTFFDFKHRNIMTVTRRRMMNSARRRARARHRVTNSLARTLTTYLAILKRPLRDKSNRHRRLGGSTNISMKNSKRNRGENIKGSTTKRRHRMTRGTITTARVLLRNFRVRGKGNSNQTSARCRRGGGDG